MSFLSNTNSQFIPARITNKGRNFVAGGNFNISYFQIGDSEYNYFINDTYHNQKVLSPFDKDDQIKYPYKLDDNEETTTYGQPSNQQATEIIRNIINPVGFVSDYNENGSTVICSVEEIALSEINGTDMITVSGFTNARYITIITKELTGAEVYINDPSFALTYKVLEVNGNQLKLDRIMPDFSSLSGNGYVIMNTCSSTDSWTMNLIWKEKPIGFNISDDISIPDKYTSSSASSMVEYLGYNTSSGQTSNERTGFYDSYGYKINVLPEEQKNIAVIHFSDLGDINTNPDLFYKYDDYIGASITDGVVIDDSLLTDNESFEIYIPFINYHRETTDINGLILKMDETDQYIDSAFAGTPGDIRTKALTYRDLIDSNGFTVGKVFYEKKIIVIDDQELVTVLDNKSNRKYTLATPNTTTVTSQDSTFLFDGVSEQEYWLTYMFTYSGDNNLNGLPCTNYTSLNYEISTGNTCPAPLNSNISMRFHKDSFNFMQTGFTNVVDGFIADGFHVLIQETSVGEAPTSDQWTIIDMTNEIPNHIPGSIINPTNMIDNNFIITRDLLNSGSLFDLNDYMNTETTDVNNPVLFGAEQPFTGSIKLTRCSDIKRMRYLINLPSTQFLVSQNPSYIDEDVDKKITEVGLFNDDGDLLIIAKLTTPITREGTQTLVVGLDF